MLLYYCCLESDSRQGFPSAPHRFDFEGTLGEVVTSPLGSTERPFFLSLNHHQHPFFTFSAQSWLLKKPYSSVVLSGCNVFVAA
jgi:hypothetical protein